MLMLLLGVCMVTVLFLHIISQTVAGVSKVYFFFLSIFGTLFNPLEAMISWLGIFTFEPTETVPYCPVEMDEYGKFLMLVQFPVTAFLCAIKLMHSGVWRCHGVY